FLLSSPSSRPHLDLPSVPTRRSSDLRSSRNPRSIPTLFDRSFTVPHNDPVLLRLRAEALTLKLEDYPFSGNYLLRAFVEQVMVLDRKSTRLNSSHVSISYAVFCLKKK